MSDQLGGSARGRSARVEVLLIIIFAAVAGIFVMMMFCCPRCGIETPDQDFGNDQFNTTYYADAVAITPEGGWIGEGIETAAMPPTIIFSEDFEGTLGGWDLVNDAAIAINTSYFGNQSVALNNSNDGNAALGVSTTISMAPDETIQTYFFVLANPAWDDGDDDYFVLRIYFSGGNALVYEILGDYPGGNSSEAIIDVSSQVTILGLWVGIDIERIDEDYLVQFGSTSLPVPDITGFVFELDSSETNETLYLDEVEMKITPKAVEGDGFWEKKDTDQKVTSYFVMVDYLITTYGDIDNDSVHAEFTLWVTIYDDEAKTSVVLPLTMIQDDLVTPAVPNADQTWLSKVFTLPEDDSILGANLWFEFSIRVEVWGKIYSLPPPDQFVYASDEAAAFDTLAFEYTAIEGSIDVILYVLGGGTGAFAVTTVLLARRKQRKDGMDASPPLSERESLFG